MALSDAERLKRLWASIFRRKSHDGGYAGLFDSLAPSNRNALLAVLELREAELPVIGSVQDQDNWMALTTERLVWCIGGKRLELANEAIQGASTDLRKMQRNRQMKLTLHELEVMTADANYTIGLEPGWPLIGLWHILNNLGGRNHRARERAEYSSGGAN